jgi:predicted short-subunit dehydrogenase-like oxidoreductase (DUF2520 family)
MHDNLPESIAFIGAGRLASGLAMALAAAGLAPVAVASRNPASAARLAARLPGCLAVPSQQAADSAGLLFITVPDDAIGMVAGSVRWRTAQAVIHCSGATEISALAPAAAAGARIGGFHPLQTFTHADAAAASLAGCTISLETEDEALLLTLQALAAALGCRHIRLPAGCRARYHASGGYASQFVNALMREATDVWKSFGIAEEDALRALLPLLRGTLASMESAGVAGGMPGPVSRGDVGTIRRHVADLANVSDEALVFYCELARRTIPLALERGSLSPEKAEQLRKILARR